MTITDTEVTVRYIRNRYVPTINVKHHFWWPEIAAKYGTEGHEYSGETGFLA